MNCAQRLMLLLALVAAPVAAATLTVEGVTSPAWVERGGGRIPLAVGMPLVDRDRIVTGPGARALLRMAEGSAVKLGENAALTLDDLADRRNRGVARLVTASLDVLRGAIRFTTGVFGKPKANRDVKLRITTITAGIRGTDVWGKSAADRDIVCLIEGRIGVEHGKSALALDEPMSFYIAPRKGESLPVASVSKEQLATWAAETEIAAGSGGARRGGRHFVEAAVVPDQRAALAEYDRLRAAGYPAVIRPVRKADGSLEYRVRVPYLLTSRDAAAVVEQLTRLGAAAAPSR